MMEKQTILATALAACIIFTAVLAYQYAYLYEENQTLAQQYEWAMEMAKFSPEERKELAQKIADLPPLI